MARLWCILGAALAMALFVPRPATAQELTERVEALPYNQQPCSSYANHNCKAAKKDRLPISPQDRAWTKARGKECDAGSIASCRALGEAYRLGIGVPSNRAVAQKLFEQACDGEDGAACGMLADIRATLFEESRKGPGPVVSRWLSQADDINGAIAKTYDRGCTLGYLPACSSYAEALFAGNGVSADPRAATQLLDETCARGLEEACTNLAQRLLYGESLGKDTDRAIMLLDDQCRRGYAGGCEMAARFLFDQPDEARLRRHFLELGCENASADSCHDLGTLRIGADRDGALPLFEKACALMPYHCTELERIRAEPGLAAACDRGGLPQCDEVGGIYQYGSTALRSQARAQAAFARACFGGLVVACAKAADAAFAEGGAARAKAVAYLERGCAAEEINACRMLAAALETGRTAPPDPVRAGEVYAFLCGKGDNISCDRQAELAETVPEVPPPPVDRRYVSPETPRRQGREKAAIVNCETHRERFRGELLSDTICRSVVKSIGGYAVRPGSAPWQALIARPSVLNNQAVVGPGRVLCGGSLIARGWILTEAHCLYGDKQDLSRAGYTVRLGVHRSHEDEGISYPILRAVVKPGYRVDDPDKVFDVALIQYDYRRGQQVGPTQSIRTIRLDPLPVDKRPITARMPVYAYGWGWTAVTDSEAANELRGVKMELLDTAACNRLTRFSGDRRNIVLCAGGRKREQACFGDSGGPLVYYGDADKVPSLIGVVSAGRKCGTTGEASRYTRVASVIDWINQTIKGPNAQAR